MDKIECNCDRCSKSNVCKFVDMQDEIVTKLNNVITCYETNIFFVNMKCACFEPIKPTPRVFGR